MSISVAAACAVFLGAFFLSIRSSWKGTLVCIALMPWYGVAVDPGIELSAYRLVLFGWIGAVVIQRIAGTPRLGPDSKQRGHLSIWGGAFLIYCATWTIVQLPFVPSTAVTGGPLRAVPQLRSTVQVFWFLFRFAPVLLLPAIVTRVDQLASAARVYLASLTILAALGWLQIGLWVSTGVDITSIGLMPSLFGASAPIRHGMFTLLGRPLLRMSSMGGEPKALGQSLAVGLLLLETGALFTRVRLSKVAVLWVLFLISMLATLSTSALYVWSGGTVLLLGYFAFAGAKGRVTIPLYASCLIAICLLVLVGAAIASGLTTKEVGGILSARTIQRRTVPDFDIAVWRFLEHHPVWGLTGVGLGNINAYAANYIPRFAQHYMQGSIFVAKSGYLRLLSECGVIGLFLFLVWMWSEVRMFRNAVVLGRSSGVLYSIEKMLTTKVSTFGMVVGGFTAVMVVAFLARGYLWNEAMWSVGFLRAMRRSMRA